MDYLFSMVLKLCHQKSWVPVWLSGFASNSRSQCTIGPELFHLALRCWENDIRHLAAPDSERGNGVIAGDWEGWEQTFADIHNLSVTLPCDILPAWHWIAAGVKHYPFTEARAGDRCSCNICKGTQRWRARRCKVSCNQVIDSSL